MPRRPDCQDLPGKLQAYRARRACDFAECARGSKLICSTVSILDSRPVLKVGIGFCIDDCNMGPARVLEWDPFMSFWLNRTVDRSSHELGFVLLFGECSSVFLGSCFV